MSSETLRLRCSLPNRNALSFSFDELNRSCTLLGDFVSNSDDGPMWRIDVKVPIQIFKRALHSLGIQEVNNG